MTVDYTGWQINNTLLYYMPIYNIYRNIPKLSFWSFYQCTSLDYSRVGILCYEERMATAEVDQGNGNDQIGSTCASIGSQRLWFFFYILAHLPYQHIIFKPPQALILIVAIWSSEQNGEFADGQDKRDSKCLTIKWRWNVIVGSGCQIWIKTAVGSLILNQKWKSSKANGLISCW